MCGIYDMPVKFEIKLHDILQGDAFDWSRQKCSSVSVAHTVWVQLHLYSSALVILTTDFGKFKRRYNHYPWRYWPGAFKRVEFRQVFVKTLWDGCGERRFAVINVANGANVDVRLVAHKHFLAQRRRKAQRAVRVETNPLDRARTRAQTEHFPSLKNKTWSTESWLGIVAP